MDNTTGTHSNTITYTVNPAPLHPQLSISPTSGTLGTTSFTDSFSGFTPNGGITLSTTYPNGTVQTFNYTANASGSASSGAFVLTAQSGNYSANAVDNTTGTHSNTITYTVNPAPLHPQLSISPTSGTLGTTSFTDSFSGFTPNGGITLNTTYPNGTVQTFHYNANSSGSASSGSFVLTAQRGTYHATAIDDQTGTASNTVTYTVQ